MVNKNITPAPVTELNSPGVYINGVVMLLANKLYPVPKKRVPDGKWLLLEAQITNVGTVFLTTDKAPNQFNSIMLRPGTGRRFQVQDAGIFNVMSTAANDVVIVSCEQDKE